MIPLTTTRESVLTIIIAIIILVYSILAAEFCCPKDVNVDGVLRYENGDVICTGTKHYKKWNQSFFKFKCNDGKTILFDYKD